VIRAPFLAMAGRDELITRVFCREFFCLCLFCPLSADSSVRLGGSLEMRVSWIQFSKNE
jgi:hypothetical protein